MSVTRKPLLTLTAEDLMSRETVLLPERMPLRNAARLLLRNQIGGAPVVDDQGKCVGVLSSADFLRLAEGREDATRPASPPLPITCAFQSNYRKPDGRQVILCILHRGACPVQRTITGPAGEELLECTQPRCVLADWQVVNVEELPDDEVRRFMTPDPVTVPPDATIRTLARIMTDAHIHRVIVVDEERNPVGVVSSSDLLAALADDDGDQ